MLRIAITIAKMAFASEPKNNQQESSRSAFGARKQGLGEVIPNLPKTSAEKRVVKKPVKGILTSPATEKSNQKVKKSVRFNESSFIHDVGAEKKRDSHDTVKKSPKGMFFSKYEQTASSQKVQFKQQALASLPETKNTSATLQRTTAKTNLNQLLKESQKMALSAIDEESEALSWVAKLPSEPAKTSFTIASDVEKKPKGILNYSVAGALKQDSLKAKTSPNGNRPVLARGVRFSPNQHDAAKHPDRTKR